MSAAVVRARLASLEPSVAKRILAGKMLTMVPSFTLCALSLSTMMPLGEASRTSAQTYHPMCVKGGIFKVRLVRGCTGFRVMASFWACRGLLVGKREKGG